MSSGVTHNESQPGCGEIAHEKKSELRSGSSLATNNTSHAYREHVYARHFARGVHHLCKGCHASLERPLFYGEGFLHRTVQYSFYCHASCVEGLGPTGNSKYLVRCYFRVLVEKLQ